jgi:hypothetical protein
MLAYQAHVALAEDELDKDFEPDPKATWDGEFSRSKL